MATITTSWSQVKSVYVGNDGNHDVYWRMYARISAQSGSNTTVQVQGRLYVSGSQGSLYCGPTTTSGGVVGNYSSWGESATGTYYTGETTLWNGSDTTSGASISAGVRFYSSPWGWTGDNLYISDTLTFASSSTPPTGLDANNVVRGVESFTANVYITGWGTGTGTRYRELQCWTYDPSSFVQPRRYQPAYGDSLSGNITVDNSSGYTQASGPLNITGNTKYVLGLYASNGTADTGSQRLGEYTTLAYAPEVSISSISSTSATLAYSTKADGGEYAKTYEYSIDGGTTWTTFATVSSGSATTGTFTVSGLTVATVTIMQTRVTTTAGTTVGPNITLNTNAGPKLYGSVNSQAREVGTLYGSVSGQTVAINKLYGSVNGVTKRIY